MNLSQKIDNYPATSFQKKVWHEMLKIPRGSVISYKELAQNIGKPKAYRAVANACGKNPFPIDVPCHRVIASNCLLYTSPSPRDGLLSRMPSSA